jgi:hypothetical protein
MQCQYKIRWTFGTDTQCEKEHHIDQVIIDQEPDKRFHIVTIGDGQPDTHVHYAHVGPFRTTLSWAAGDRREFTGDWPGACIATAGCTLPTRHHGRCAP